MANDFLERLADADVPPPPAEFDGQLHLRVNRSLLVVHLVDLICGAFPWAVLELGRALGGCVRFTLTGNYEGPRGKRFKQ
jgi:hypothetical protein